MTTNKPKTLGEALAQGYTIGETMTQNKYVSRKTEINDDTPLIECKANHRKGQLYYELPNWKSTRYSYRQYLIEPNN